jgi:hypothetical protein
MPSPCNDGPSALVPPELCRNTRRGARDSLIDFARAIDVPGRPVSEDQDEPRFAAVETALARHHRLLLKTCQRAVNTRNGRVMILMPPGSGKSTYCSVVLPAFLMGRKPGYRVIVASYGTDLAKKHGRRARAIVRSARYQQIFKTTLGREAAAAGGFVLTNGSEYMAAGMLAGITGNRADGLVIDDPVKGRDEADSGVTRERTRASYEDDLKTRLLPGGFIVLIQTRWHADDLAGSILPENWAGESGPIRCRDGMIWNVLCLRRAPTGPTIRSRGRSAIISGRSGFRASTGASSKDMRAPGRRSISNSRRPRPAAISTPRGSRLTTSCRRARRCASTAPPTMR